MAVQELTKIPVPPRYGLINDEQFRRLRFAVLSRDNAQMIGPSGKPLAVFSRLKLKILKRLPLVELLSFGGIAESPLLDTEEWSDEAYFEVTSRLADAPGWHMGRLGGLTNHETERVCGAAKRAALHYRVFPSHAWVITGFDSFEKYFRSRSRSFRSSMLGAGRKIAKDGFEFRESIDAQEWRKLYERRHAIMPEHDYSISGEFQRFLNLIREEFKRSGRLREVGLWRGNELVAAGLGLKIGDILYFYQTAHDPSFRAYRPGAMVFYRMIERALNEGVGMVAFQSNADYLSHYTDQVVRIDEVELFSRAFMARLVYAYRQFKKKLPSH